MTTEAVVEDFIWATLDDLRSPSLARRHRLAAARHRAMAVLTGPEYLAVVTRLEVCWSLFD